MANQMLKGGDSIKVTLSGTVTANSLGQEEDIICMYSNAGVSGDVVSAHVTGEARYAKAAETFAAGDRLYYHAGNDNITVTSTSAVFCGTCSEAAASGASEGTFLLNVGIQA